MPIKLSDEVRTQFDTNLSTIKKFNAKDLIRRDELGSELNFADAETDFETAINLFKGLAEIDIMRVPESIIRDLNNEMSTFINSIEQIKSFSSMQGPDVRQSLIDNITNNYNNSWFKTISPIVAYCTKAGTDYESLQRQAHEALENIKKEHEQAKQEIEETQKYIMALKEAVQKAAKSVGVTNHTVNFQEAANMFEKSRDKWFWWIIALSIVIMAYSSITFWWCPVVLEEPYLYKFAQAILPRFTGLIVLFYILITCGNNYRAQAHNYIINKNKQNALSTFETFVKATNNEEIRNAVLLQTTKAIFSNPKSGYLKEDGSDDEPTQIIEIVKDMSKVIKS